MFRSRNVPPTSRAPTVATASASRSQAPPTIRAASVGRVGASGAPRVRLIQ
jgi:hypothetical protein